MKAVVAAMALAVSACAPAAGNPGGGPTDGVGGQIYVSGSSTVEPISQAVAEEFKALNPGFGYTVEGPGTGDGFALFCDGTTDVADASRAIREPEMETCAANGIEYVELKVGFDGMAVVTHPQTPIECLNFADLYALLGPESDHVGTWQEAQTLAHQLGSATSLPQLPLQITAPGEESGTYDSFVELAISDLAEERGQLEGFLRVPGPSYTASPNDNVIVEGIVAGPGTLGFVGYAFFVEAGEAIKAIAVDAGDGCVLPTPETIADGSYPLSRPLFIYPNVHKAAANPALSAWVDFYLSDEGVENVAETGYVVLPPADLDVTRQAWAER